MAGLRLCHSQGGGQFILSLLLFFTASISWVWGYGELSDDSLRKIPAGNHDFDIHSGRLLAPILIPRVPGTPGSLKVQHHFADYFATELPRWNLEWHNSTSKTPATGETDVPFHNLIFSRDPPWAQPGDVGRLTLVAHFDSMYRPEGFIGAIDSAAPCAILMHVARSIDEALTKKWAAMEASGDWGLEAEEKGVQIMFLDGEEAWVTWTSSDSIYGSRALAESWENKVHPPGSAHRTAIESIKLFLLLDLLGAPDPHVPSYFPTTHEAYRNMARIESRMRSLGLLASNPMNPFLPDSGRLPHQFVTGAFVGDDHIPFMDRGVEVLHIIPTPFPPEWHTMNDNGENLDPAAMDDWAKIVTAFAAEWMELDEYMEALLQQPHEPKESRKHEEL